MPAPRKDQRGSVECRYHVRVVLNDARCRRLRRLVRERGRDPSEVMSLCLDLFWVAMCQGVGSDAGGTNSKSKRGLPGRSANARAEGVRPVSVDRLVRDLRRKKEV